jgi:beta-lactam-binding protein with PASTA domain
LTKSKASAALKKAGCKLGKTKKKKLKKFTKKQKKNRVRSQSPAAGQVVAAGTSVTITINVKKPKKLKKH